MNFFGKHKALCLLLPAAVLLLVIAFFCGGTPTDAPETPAQTAPASVTDTAAPSASGQPAPAAPSPTVPPTDAPDAVGTPAPADAAGQTPDAVTPDADAASETPKAVTPDAETAPSVPTEPVTPDAEASVPAQTESDTAAPAEEPADSDGAYSCTLSISCAVLCAHPERLSADKQTLLPDDGWLLPPTEAVFYEGESVFNVFQRVCKQEKLHMEFVRTPLDRSAYIEGIGNLYEFDAGELSGWMYAVNDWFPNYSSAQYALSDGDEICWHFTCDLGEDVGGGYAGEWYRNARAQ